MNIVNSCFSRPLYANSLFLLVDALISWTLLIFTFNKEVFFSPVWWLVGWFISKIKQNGLDGKMDFNGWISTKFGVGDGEWAKEPNNFGADPGKGKIQKC